MRKKPPIYQKPIGIVMHPYQGIGTGNSIPTIIGMKGLAERYDAVTISVYRQPIGVPVVVIALPWRD